MDEFSTPPPTPNPEPASIPPLTPPLTAMSLADNSGLPPNVAAGLCALLPLVGGIVFLMVERTNAFVRFWAMQSLLFGAALAIISILVSVATFILAHIPIIGWLMLLVLWPVSILFWLGALIVWIIMLVKAFSGVEWELPYLGKMARRQLLSRPLL